VKFVEFELQKVGKMNIQKVTEFCSWYGKNREFYEELTEFVKELLVSTIAHSRRREIMKIDLYSVEARCKQVDSLRDKLLSDEYPDDFPAKEIFDLVGSRVIGYSKYDVENIVELIKNNFIVHKIEDKQLRLGKAGIGYQSIHIIASLKGGFSVLAEQEKFERFKDIRFEIQVRTLLQETWAAINHKKSYKFKGFLPDKIERKLYLFSAVTELLDDELEGITQEILKLVSSLKSEFKEMETTHENISHYLYVLKIIHDLNLYNVSTLSNPHNLQKLIFGTSYSIETNYTGDKHILEKWVNDKLEPYEIALDEIDFSEVANEKILEFIRNQLKVVIKHGNNESPNLIVRGFGTIWKRVRANYNQLDYPTNARFTISRNEPMRLESRADFILQIGIWDAYLYTADGNRLSIFKGGNKMSCQDIPPGEYDLVIKTEYEPSNDNMADFIDRIKII
jgi:ppGpp synthetase/RelA/SpoT-type nucleotidyltranferase